MKKRVKPQLKMCIRNTRLFQEFRTTALYRKYLWYYYFKELSKKSLLKEAREKFATENPAFGSLEDYKIALYNNLVSYSEYMYQYEFYKLTETQRKEYVSRLEMRLWYQRNSNTFKVENAFWIKSNWLNLFSDFIHRSWINPKEQTWISFKNLLQPAKQYIIKPDGGSLGQGIFKMEGKDFTEETFVKLKKESYIVEELVTNEPSIASFHPASLNTIRVTSLSSGDIVGSFIRFGNHGNVVDNAHAGGIFAQIDIETGEICTDGIDTDGNTYIEHPYSNKKIKGFIIPKWPEIKDLIQKLHLIVPEASIVGWDICLTADNKIDIIEGNHLPDMDVLQSPQKIGIRRRLERLLEDADLPGLSLK